MGIGKSGCGVLSLKTRVQGMASPEWGAGATPPMGESMWAKPPSKNGCTGTTLRMPRNKDDFMVIGFIKTTSACRPSINDKTKTN